MNSVCVCVCVNRTMDCFGDEVVWFQFMKVRSEGDDQNRFFVCACIFSFLFWIVRGEWYDMSTCD